MASKARQAFDENVKDVDRLLSFHAKMGGSSKGRRHGLEVLNKSAIVLITAFWEAYCEDIAAEGLHHLVEHLPSADKLPKELKKKVAADLKSDANNIAIWEIADEKWRDYLRARLAKLQQERNQQLNTPKSYKLDDLFEEAVGITKISNNWNLSPKINAAQAKSKLDGFVTLRGNIAHRGSNTVSVKKSEVVAYLALVKRLASKTGGAVNRHVKAATRKPLW